MKQYAMQALIKPNDLAPCRLDEHIVNLQAACTRVT